MARHIRYDPTSNSVSAYEPTIRGISDDDYMATVNKYAVDVANLYPKITATKAAPVAKFNLDAGTSAFLKQIGTNNQVKELKKNGPESFFKGKQRSDLSPSLRKLYDKIEKEKKDEGLNIKSNLMGGLGRVLDVMSRFNYGSAEAVNRVWDQSMDNSDDSKLQDLGDAFADAGKGFVSGIMGKDKTTFGHVLQHMKDSEKALQHGKDPRTVKYGYNKLGTGDSILKGGLGFTLDVLLDPTTYVGVGLVKTAIKGAGSATKLGHVSKEVEDVADKLFDEYGVRAVNAKHEPIHNKEALIHEMSPSTAHTTVGKKGTAVARTGRVRKAQTFVASAKAMVHARELARFRDTIKLRRAPEFHVAEDVVETSGPKIMDVPMDGEDIAAVARYKTYKGQLGSKKASLSKAKLRLQKQLTNAHDPNAVSGAISASERIVRELADVEGAIAKVDSEMARINKKFEEQFNVVDGNVEKLGAIMSEANKHPEVTNLNRQIADARNNLTKSAKAHDRKLAKQAKETAGPTAKVIHGKQVEKKGLTTVTKTEGHLKAEQHLQHLLDLKHQTVVRLADEAAVRVAPDKGTVTSIVRAEGDNQLLKRMSEATSPDELTAVRRELAYRMAEKGDGWLNGVVGQAAKHHDGLIEDLKNLTPLKRPGNHVLKKRQIVEESTTTKVATKMEKAQAAAHNKKLEQQIEKEAEQRATEFADAMENQLLEIMAREANPTLKRGISLKLMIPGTKSNTPEAAKVLFALSMPDAVSKAVNKYVFRDTVKEGLTRWGNFFKSSAGTDELMNEMRLSYNGAAGFRIEEHAKRLRNMWQKVPPATRRAGLRQWLRYGDKIDGEAVGPYSELVRQVNDEFTRLTAPMTQDFPDGVKITAADYDNWLPDKMKFGKLTGDDAKLPVGSAEWVRASLRHVSEDVDPAELLWHMNIAREKVLVRTAMKDNLRYNFGVEKIAGSESMANKLIKDHGYKEVTELGPKFIFPPDVADDITKTFDLMKNQRQIHEVIRFYDSVLSVYKSTVTMYNPGYHMRNCFGDGFMSYLAGVSGKRGLMSYKHAGKTLRAMKGLEDSNPAIHGALMDINPKAAFDRIDIKPTTQLWTTPRGKKVTAEEVWVLYNHYGLHSGFVANEFGSGFGRPGTLRATGAGQKVTAINRGAQGLSENREDFFRLAHFIDVMKQSKNPNLDRAAAEAASSVRKYMFDYSDFTQMEKAVMVRAFPFYKWTRKALPLMAETLFAQPGKALMYPKAMRNLSMAMGYDMGDKNGIIPASDVIIPEWIRNRGMYPLGSQDGNTVLGDAAMPFNDVVRTVSSPLDSMFSMLTPSVRIPMELKFNKQMYSGAPIFDKSDYATSTIPQGSFVNQMLRKHKQGDANGVAGTLLDPRTIQFLSGVTLSENTESQMRSELMNQARQVGKAHRKNNPPKKEQ